MGCICRRWMCADCSPAAARRPWALAGSPTQNAQTPPGNEDRPTTHRHARPMPEPRTPSAEKSAKTACDNSALRWRRARAGCGYFPPLRRRHFPAFPRRTTMGFLTCKKLLITGVLSNRSIAYGIAKACHAQGAELAFSYVGERFKDRITEFAADFDSKLVFDCDVGSDEQIEKLFTDLAAVWPKFDGFVHAIGFAPREAIAGDFLDGLSREGFKIAHDISAYSFPAMAKAALPYLNDKSALLTLRYLAESLGPKGMRVNGISAGPIKTLAASGIKGFGKILSVVAETSPIRRNVTIEDVGNVAAFLLSDLAGGVTAATTYVYGGFSQVVGGIAEPAGA